uniref:Outer dense fiber of sperm tails 3-like 2b n=1 Tax=Salmo trutta TaxID=8032 RepID=A0A674DEN9_SALTR
MLKAPAFSFGTRHNQLSSDCSPGPGYLVPSNITRIGHDGTPSYSLYSHPKDPQLFQTPGPGRYSPERSGQSANYSAPAYSLSARSKGFRNDQTPGPAAYMLPSVLGPATVNKTSIGSFHEDLQKVDLTCRTQTLPYGHLTSPPPPPHYSMTGCNSMPGDTTMKPGPGAHHPVTFTRIKPPSFTFGIHNSEFIAPLTVDMV